MSKKRRGLGNLGVDVLLSAVSPAPSRNPEEETQPRPTSPQGETLKWVPVEAIHRGRYQPRQNIHSEALEELAASIKAQGMVQPVVLRPSGEGYELIAGERRWRAAQMAGLEEVPAVVRDIPDQAAAAMSLIENIQREELSPLDEATAFKRLIDEFELTHQEVADSVGRSRVSVSNMLRLLELAPPAAGLLQEGRLEMGHARALLALPTDRQPSAATHVADRGFSVRETERYVRKLLQGGPARRATPTRDPDVLRLENTLADRLGARVDIHYNARGKGSLVIHYNNMEELEGLLEHIQ